MRFATLIFTCIALAGCSVELTESGSQVRQISASTSNTCEFLGPVTASESFGLDEAMDVQSSFNQVRNEVANRGGNSFVVSASNTSEFSTVVQADAYRC